MYLLASRVPDDHTFIESVSYTAIDKNPLKRFSFEKRRKIECAQRGFACLGLPLFSLSLSPSWPESIESPLNSATREIAR